jgi:hypothetical protein
MLRLLLLLLLPLLAAALPALDLNGPQQAGLDTAVVFSENQLFVTVLSPDVAFDDGASATVVRVSEHRPRFPSALPARHRRRIPSRMPSVRRSKPSSPRAWTPPKAWPQRYACCECPHSRPSNHALAVL